MVGCGTWLKFIRPISIHSTVDCRTNTSKVMDEGTANLSDEGEGGSNTHVISAVQAVTGMAEILVGGSGGSVE